ncbi:MAG: ABC transporter substrate binding protein [Gallionellaceae bacterium]
MRAGNFIITLCVILCATCSVVRADDDVLLLNSYHSGFEWTENIMSGIRSTLSDSPTPVNLSIEFMDTKRRNDEAHFQNLYQLFANKYKNTQFKAIITTDNDAFNFMRKYRDTLFPQTPVIFTGVNFFRDEQLAGINGFTGVVETFDGAQTIDLMLTLHPGTKRIVIILDGTTTGKTIRSELDGILPAFKKRVQFDFILNESLSSTQQKVEALKSDSLILLMPFARDSEGTVVSYSYIANLISRVSSVPVYGTWDFYLGHGIVGGRLTDGFSQGSTAAMKVLRVLKGEAPESIPIQRSSPTRFMFDTRQLKRFKISESDLPKDSYLGYQTWYESNRHFILMGVLIAILFIVMVFLLVYVQYKRRQAEKNEIKERKQAALQFSKLSQQVPGTIFQFQLFQNGESCFPYASEGIKDIYEVTPEQVKEDASAVFSNLHPDDFDRVSQSIQDSARTLQTWQLEYRVNLPKKGVHWLSGLSRPERLEDGSTLWNGFITDITERRLAEVKINALQHEQEAMLETSLAGIAKVQDRVFTWVNPSLEKMLGYEIGELVGKPTCVIYVTEQDFLDLGAAAYPVLAEGNVYRTQMQFAKKEGGAVWADMNGVMLDSTSGVSFWTFNDISDEKQAEQILLEGKQAAESLAQSKSEFLANMSHEIRTPMNAIIGLSQLALNKDMSDEVRDYLEKINSSSGSLLGILNDILDFSKIEAGKLGIENTGFSLPNLLDNLYNIFTARAQEKHIGFTIEVAPEIPHELVGDPMRIQQILSNLIGNALKFTSEGKVTVQVQLLEMENSQARLRFSVSDSGIGLSPQQQANLFQPFSQVDTSITRRFGGTGLGLSISHRLLQLMGGTFHIDSELDVGTTFSFELLLGISSEELHQTVTRRDEPSGAGSLSDKLLERGEMLKGKRILVAEDNRINQMVVKEFLKLAGVEVDIANHGGEALVMLKDKTYDAILMDVHMPEMGGLEATEKIRQQAQFSSLPIIALTAGVTQEERDNCKRCGMNDFVTKPVNPEELIGVLCHWIGKEIKLTSQELKAEPIQPSQPNEVLPTSARLVEKAASGSISLTSLPGFNLSNVLEMLGGDEAVAYELLSLFREDIGTILFEIEDYVKQNNLPQAGLVAHRIKGTAGNLGASALRVVAGSLEMSFKQNRFDEEAYAEFKRLMLEAKSTLDDFL